MSSTVSNTHIHSSAVVDYGATIADDVEIGANSILHKDVDIAQGSRIGPNVVFMEATDDFAEESLERANTVGINAVVHANSVIRRGVQIGRGATVEPGSVATRDIPPFAVVRGNPAEIVRYTEANVKTPTIHLPDEGSTQSNVRGVELIPITHAPDLRGDLCAAEWPDQLPFSPQRLFFVFNVPSVRARGEHAHKTCHQLLICATGSIHVIADDGKNREEFILDRPNTGLYLPPKTWGIQYNYTSDAVLLVLASHHYDDNDYIRDYEEFLTYLAEN